MVHPPRCRPLAGVPVLEDLLPLDGARVLVHADLDVPLARGATGTAAITDNERIDAVLPTLSWLHAHGAEVTVSTHLDRPAGTPNLAGDVEAIGARLGELVPGVALIAAAEPGPEDAPTDELGVDGLLARFDAYVNDAFACSHRPHALSAGSPGRLPSAAGRLLTREVSTLARLLDAPARPLVVAVGGAKVSEKLGAVGALLERADRVLVGGEVAFTFLAAKGHPTGRSHVDTGYLHECTRIVVTAGDRLVLPTDLVVLGPDGSIGAGSPGTGIPAIIGADVAAGWRGVDIGPRTRARFAEHLSTARSVFWNGPMGAFEDPRFAGGTQRVATAVAAVNGFTVVGGRSTVAALDEGRLTEQISFVSTGGDAALSFLEQGDLPGIMALRAAPNAPGPQSHPAAPRRQPIRAAPRTTGVLRFR